VLLIPNEFLHPAFGKFLFATCDIIVGGLLYNILKRTNSRAYLWVGILWLLNPIVANISTRGSAESVLGAIVISTLSLALKGRMDAAAAMLGLAVHFKIYPFIYGASILAFLGSKAKGTKEKEGTVARIVALVTKERVRFTVVSLASFFMLNAVMFAM
jgi:phosphatidylinositol glycan class M